MPYTMEQLADAIALLLLGANERGDEVDIAELFKGRMLNVTNNTTQTVQIGYGKINFPKKSMTLTGFVVEDGFKRTLVSKRHTKIGRTNLQPISNNPDMDGYLYTDNVQIPDGTILCFQGSSRIGGLPLADGAIFVRARKDGAGLLIQAKLPLGGLVTSHVAFSGHGDVLKIDELFADGVEVPAKYAKGYTNPEEVGEVFSVREITPAKSAAPVVEVHVADDGREVKLNVSKPARRMRIKR